MIALLLQSYIYLQQHFKVSPIIVITMIIMTLLAFFALIGIMMVLLLDSAYRPNVPQYPFNTLLDRIIPLIAIVSPSILILSLNENISYITKLGYIILIHALVLCPIMFYWSTHRNWFQNKTEITLWSHPGLYLNITIAIIYPAIWCLYLSCVRYLRLGIAIDLTDYFQLNHILILISVIVLLYYFKKDVLTIVLMLKDLRLFFWNKFLQLANSLLIVLLKYKIIFKFLEIIYIISYIWVTYIIHDAFIYQKNPRSIIRSLMHKIYLYPIIVYLFLVIFMLIEAIIFKGLIFYSLYLLLLVMLIRPFIYFLNAFNGPENEWVSLCCQSNYVYNKWTEAYYPKRFWLSYQDLRVQYDNRPTLTEHEKSHISLIIQKWIKKHDYDRKVNNHVFLRLIQSPKTTFYHRLRLTYYHWTNIK